MFTESNEAVIPIPPEEEFCVDALEESVMPAIAQVSNEMFLNWFSIPCGAD